MLYILTLVVLLYPFLPNMLGLLLMLSLPVIIPFSSDSGDAQLTKTKMDFPIALFLVIITISTITSTTFLGSIRDLALHLGDLSILFVLVNWIKDKNGLYVIITILIVTASLISLYGIYQYLVGVELDETWIDMGTNPDISVRVYSIFDNPNILAEYLVMILPLSISMFIYSRMLNKKIIFFGASLVMLITLILTSSRGGWLGFAFSCTIFILLFKRGFLLGLIPIGILGYFILPDPIINRIMSIGNLRDTSNAYRLNMWLITLEIIRDNWMAGVGFGHLPYKETFENYSDTIVTYHSHNTYLQTLAEMGVPGLLVLLLFLLVLFKYGIKYLIKQDDRYIVLMATGALSSLAGIMVHGFFENILYLPKIIFTFWIIVSIILVLFRLVKAGG